VVRYLEWGVEMRNHGSIVFGVLLMFMGAFFLLNNFDYFRGEGFLIFLGLAFVAAYFLTGRPVGLLIPGFVLMAIGSFASVERGFFGFKLGGGWFFIFLGSAFAAIFIVDSFGRATPTVWPLYPAAGLLLFGLFITAGEILPKQFWHLAGGWWPAVLILAGLIILLRPRH